MNKIVHRVNFAAGDDVQALYFCGISNFNIFVSLDYI
jgi:hypothetical protein